MLTVENMGPVREAFRQDLRDMVAGTYKPPVPHISMQYEDDITYRCSRNHLGIRKNPLGINGRTAR